MLYNSQEHEYSNKSQQQQIRNGKNRWNQYCGMNKAY